MANPEHLALLQQGTAIWNDWRKRNPGSLPDLSGANLRQANLDGANLCGANLSGANLSGANLSRTEFGTDLSGANLTGTSIYGIAAWDVKPTAGTQQKNLIITPPGQTVIAVDNIKVAQFIYLLLIELFCCHTTGSRFG
jgi:uncharacterized protein YjbI with pentapeptide repeats